MFRTSTSFRTLPSLANLADRLWVLATAAIAVVCGVFLALPWLPGPPHQVFTLCGLALVTQAAITAVTDYRGFRIPNRVTYTAFTLGLALNASASLAAHLAYGSSGVFPQAEAWLAWTGGVGLTDSLLGAGVCFLVMAVVYQFTGSGAGDVKLATACGALAGLQDGFAMLAWAHLLAAAGVLVWIGWTVGPLRLGVYLTRWVASRLFPIWILPPVGDARPLLKRPIPIACFYALGTLLVLLSR